MAFSFRDGYIAVTWQYPSERETNRCQRFGCADLRRACQIANPAMTATKAALATPPISQMIRKMLGGQVTQPAIVFQNLLVLRVWSVRCRHPVLETRHQSSDFVEKSRIAGYGGMTLWKDFHTIGAVPWPFCVET